MRSQHIPMSIDEFHLLPRKPGWKHEYYDGKAHLHPGHRLAVVRLEVGPRPNPPPCPLQPVTRADRDDLVAAFYDCFKETVEYCDWKEAKIRSSGIECIDTFLKGKRGEPLPASRLARQSLEPGGQPLVVGAALLIYTTEGPMLDMLFVRPEWQRQGLATALVAAAVNELYAAGEKSLISTHHLANEASAEWHQKFGFLEVPDLMLAEMRERHFAYELRRREQAGTLIPEDRASLEAMRDDWRSRARVLKERARREGFEAVSPILRLKPARRKNS